MGELIFIGLLFIIAASALWVVSSPNLVHSAVSLLFTLFGVAGLYVFLYADFLAATQVVIYVGGILVLIIFGVMLTNKIDKPIIESNSSNKIIGVFISGFIFLILSIIIFQTNWNALPNNSEGSSTVALIVPPGLFRRSRIIPFVIPFFSDSISTFFNWSTVFG